MFAKWMVTLPALAVNESLVNLSWPLGLAASLIALPPPPPPPAAAPPELLDDVELDEAGADDVLLLLEPPQAATPTAMAATLRARAEILVT